MEGPVELVVAWAADHQGPVHPLHLDRRMELTAQLTLGPPDDHRPAVDGDLDARWDGDGETTDPRHRHLPHVGEDLPAKLGLAGLGSGHDPPAGADDDD